MENDDMQEISTGFLVDATPLDFSRDIHVIFFRGRHVLS